MKKISLLGFVIATFFIVFLTNEDIAKGASDPYTVSSTVKNNWDEILGQKTYSLRSGKKIVYDIYSQKYTSGGYKITTKDFGKGSQKYINFQGWSVIFGRAKHTDNNNETYIVARKVIGEKNLGQTKVFSTLKKNVDATEDLEYNNQGSGVFNECPAGAVNQDNEWDCNFRYENVGFDAYLPVDELFPDENENASWTLFLVKKVDDYMVYTPLIMPFSFNDKAYSNGHLSLSSGVSTNLLQMIGNGVLRRSEPRQTASKVITELGEDRYFTRYDFYTPTKAVNEEETAVWYGVKSPKDNDTRWANTAYWNFSGNQVLLSYRTEYYPPATGICKAPVLPSDRYSYELDFAVQSVDGKTVDKGKETTTKVEVKRNSFASNREEAETAINNDIANRKSSITKAKSDLSKLKADEKKIVSDLEKAEQTTDYSKINDLFADLKVVRQNMANKECEIETLNTELEHYENELDSLENMESDNTNLTTPVSVSFNNGEKKRMNVTLAENETKTLTFKWTLDDSGTVKAVINPEHSSYNGKLETTYSNNQRSTPIFIAAHTAVNVCLVNTASYADGVVRTKNSVENGQEEYKERVTTTISIPDEHKNRRAGTGFEYTISSKYENEDPESDGTGPKKATTYMPKLVNYLPYTQKEFSSPYSDLKLSGYEVALENTSDTGTNPNTKNFNLPVFYVEQFSGNVFDANYADNPNRNPADTIIDGGRKWYIDFLEKDGTYQFSTVAEDAGINGLTTCVTGEVNISGTVIGDVDGNDDFVKRSVSPTNPFPAGTGWNWSGQENLITSLQDWFNNWYSNPSEVPTSQYKDTFVLTPELIQQIKEYNQSMDGEYKVGESVFDSVNIPSN